MEDKIFSMASAQGLWAALTVGLIFYILKNQEKRDIRQEEREQKYQDIILNLTDKLNVIDDMKKDVKDIKQHIYEKHTVS